MAKVFADDFVVGYTGSDPYLVYMGNTVYDTGGNNNGYLDPGESADFTSTLINIGGANLTNLNTTLYSSDSYITITDNTGFFGSLPVDSIKENTNDPYTISANASAPNGHHAEFMLLADADSGFVDTTYFILCIGQDVPTDTGRYFAYHSGGPHTHSPAFNWVAIDTTQSVYAGISLDLMDNQNAVVNLPFTFTYYGVDYTRVTVGSNGFIAMDSTGDVDWTNSRIPLPDGPPRMIAPFWCDLDPGNSGAPSDIYWYYDQPNNRFIIEYFQVEHWPSGSNETFEVILYDPAYYPTPTGDGEIVVQYLLPLQGTTGTIGIENSTETVGIEYYYNELYTAWAAPITAEFAIKYTTYDPTQPGISEYDDPSTVSTIQLHAQPNPFTHQTNIRYAIPDSRYTAQKPKLNIYDASGRLVRSIDLGSWIIDHESVITWNGTDQSEREVPDGVYFVYLEAGQQQTRAKIILVR
jgi:hypothetical protein